MKSFSRKIGKLFKKKEKEFAMYSMSILANAGDLNDIFDICRNIFIVLLPKSLFHCREANQYLNAKMSNIEPLKPKV